MKTQLVTLVAASLVGLSSAAMAADAPTEAQVKEITESLMKTGGTVFPIGVDNVAYEKYFTGKTFLAPLTGKGTNPGVSNVTFAPGVVNHWHTHQRSCQVLVGVSGAGYYQIWGEEPKKIVPGVTVTIPENTKHWHGAAQGSWFQHLSVMADGAGTTWMESVDPKVYQNLK